jgi:hypothetical protein
MQAIKDKIESFAKHNQIEVGRILLHDCKVEFDENKNGIFINLSVLPPNTIEKLTQYIQHVELQESYLLIDENEKDELKDIFFAK